MNKLIKEKLERYKETRLLKLIEKKRKKVIRLHSKFKKHDVILSELLNEYYRSYLY